MREAKEKWIDDQCTDTEDSLSSSNTKKAYQLVKDLTRVKQVRMNTIQDKNGNGLAEGKEMVERWTGYCSELYNFQSRGDPDVLNVHESANEDDYPVLREEAEAAIRSLKSGKTAGIDNIPVELLNNGGVSK